jgi:sugar phosphate isomerase/epimerase
MPPREERRRYLPLVKAMGFEGVEVGVDEAAGESQARDLADELKSHGLSIICVRAGGPVAHPLAGAKARRRLERAVQYAAWTGASVVNTAMVSPATDPRGRGSERRGEQISQGASRTATEADFVDHARYLREAGEQAARLGLSISIEVHQGSIADNSAATLHLLDLIGLPNVGANPDLGNIYWHYEHPDETSEAAIVALAPRAVYWHCKNLRRTHVPELHRAFFHRTPLPDGEIDYRFAISAMQAAGYNGYLAIEGMQLGDHILGDRRSAAYAQEILAELG